MNNLDQSIEIIELFDLYQSLCTLKQQQYIKAYYYNNYSITEISENMNVSRNAVHDQLTRTVEKLYDFEEKLMLRKKKNIRQALYKKINECDNIDTVKELVEELQKGE